MHKYQFHNVSKKKTCKTMPPTMSNRKIINQSTSLSAFQFALPHSHPIYHSILHLSFNLPFYQSPNVPHSNFLNLPSFTDKKISMWSTSFWSWKERTSERFDSQQTQLSPSKLNLSLTYSLSLTLHDTNSIQIPTKYSMKSSPTSTCLTNQPQPLTKFFLEFFFSEPSCAH